MAEETTKGGTNWFNQAYMVAGGGTDDLQASKGMAKIGDAIAKPVAQELQQRRAKFKAFAEWELTRKPGLTDKDYDKKIEELNKMRADYIWADNASRMKIMRHMVDMKAEQDALDAEKKALAESIEDEENGVGGNKDFMEDEKMEGLLEAYQNGPDDDGIYRDSAGNEYTEDEIKELTNDKNRKDGASEDIIRDLALQFRDVSAESFDNAFRSDGNKKFNWEETYAKIDNVVSNGNFRSLVNDNMIQGRSATFRDDLEASLMNQTYTGFGIEADSYTDPNLDGDNDYTTISPEDAKVIADEFLKMDDNGEPVNPDAKKWVTNYYTAHMEKQFNSGQSSIYSSLQFVEDLFSHGQYMDLMSDNPNNGLDEMSVEDMEWHQNKIAGSYGQLSKEQQTLADKVLKSLDESIIKKQNQNKYNTNAQ